MDLSKKRSKVQRLRTEPGVVDTSHRSAFAQWGGRYLRDKAQWTFDAVHKDAVDAYILALQPMSEEPVRTTTSPERCDASTMTDRYVLDIPDEMKDLIDAFWQ